MADLILILSLDAVEAGYRGKQILFGVTFGLAAGEVVTLLGANGSGKSTVLKTIGGLLKAKSGRITLRGEAITGSPPHAIFRLGVAQVSQARDLFPDMTVEENLIMGASVRKGPTAELLDRCFALFPRLAERRKQRVRLMSGGEQQMVAIGRALMSRPTVLLLDEPSGGLAPRFVDEIGRGMLELKKSGTTMLLVEQNLKLAFAVADRFLVLRDGLVTERGDIGTGRMTQDEIVRSIYL